MSEPFKIEPGDTVECIRRCWCDDIAIEVGSRAVVLEALPGLGTAFKLERAGERWWKAEHFKLHAKRGERFRRWLLLARDVLWLPWSISMMVAMIGTLASEPVALAWLCVNLVLGWFSFCWWRIRLEVRR